MTFGKPHLYASVVMLAGAIAYNVYVFNQPTTRPGGVQRPVSQVTGSAAVAPAAGAPTDLSQLPPVPDVALDVLPRWTRNPFAVRRAVADEEPEPILDTLADPAPAAEPDPVVSSILYSSDRKLAIVNGRVARIGDVIAGVTIVDIQPAAVVIDSRDRGRRTLSLRPTRAGGAPQ